MPAECPARFSGVMACDLPVRQGEEASRSARRDRLRTRTPSGCVEYDSGSHCDQTERKQNLQNPTTAIGVCVEKQFDPVSGKNAEQDACSDRDDCEPSRKALDFAHGIHPNVGSKPPKYRYSRYLSHFENAEVLRFGEKQVKEIFQQCYVLAAAASHFKIPGFPNRDRIAIARCAGFKRRAPLHRVRYTGGRRRWRCHATSRRS
jgi:hypothetical protein